MYPLLSIIIPCYNGEKYLEEAVNSVLNQPCKDLEIIIVDDGSRDTSGAIADRLAAVHANIRAFHIANSGVSVARNLGIDNAAGKYIGFLDADDVMCRNAYDSQIHDVLKSGEYDILSFSYMKSIQNLTWGCMMSSNGSGLYLREDPQYRFQTYKPFCSYLYKRSLFTDVIRFPAGIRYHEDVCFLFLMARSAGHILQYTKPWFVYRMNYASVMHNLKNADHVLEEIHAWEWCRKNCGQDKDALDCEGNIFSYMVEYIRRSCMCGVPVEEIQENMRRCEPFRKAMEHYGSFWLSAKTAKEYADFLATPNRFRRRYRMRGVVYFSASRFIRSKIGSVVNQKVRYRIPMGGYLTERT